MGASWSARQGGTNFAVYSEHASGVDVCLFDAAGREVDRIALLERDELIWHGFVPGVAPGQTYGFRASGAYDPANGLRFNAAKVLLDPYARAITGELRWGPEVYAHQTGRDGDSVMSALDSGGHVPLAVVVDPGDGTRDAGPRTPWADTIIYETHVRGFTMRHPDIPPPLRGTYAGLAHPAAVAHFKELGISAVELMPVHHFIDQREIVERGLCNYWGYDSVGYFAPAARYSSSGSTGGQVAEFRAMVRTLHAAGLEVLLDVVYNHTGEGGPMGATLSFRGLDNPTYYKLVEGDRRRYLDVTGTGNTVNGAHPQTLQLIMDSLRYWVTDMGVDGFRFDLAAALARDGNEVDRSSAFFDIIHQDPVLSRVKLVAEPWDLGTGGYQVGNFPVRWAEWNGRFRDTVRDFWRGADSGVGDLAYRLSGSSDLYGDDGRNPYASINFVTCHDGFTLRDLVSYDGKHNQANGEDNRDGTDDNRSWNSGIEGETDDPAILTLRARRERNLLATVLLAQGSPMILAGDDLGRTQRGNNNAYCQDNEISWLDWEAVDASLLAFARHVVALRRAEPVLRRRHFFRGQVGPGQRRKDITWLRGSGDELSESDWNDRTRRSLGMLLDGDLIPDRDEAGNSVRGSTLLVILHAGARDATWRLPAADPDTEWEVILDTALPDEAPGRRRYPPAQPLSVVAHSLMVLRRVS